MSANPKCRVLIVGGGLAGLASAIAITLAGHEALIFERMPVLREVGAGIQLPPNATTLFKDWDILEAVQAHASQPNRAIVRSYRDGNVLSTQDFGPVVEGKYGSPYLLIHRADLHKILLEKAESLGVEIKLSCDISQDDLDVSKPAICLGKAQIHEGDLILGADGERSVCREKVLGTLDPLRSTGDLIFRFTVKMDDLEINTDLKGSTDLRNINYWMGPDSHAVSYVMEKSQLLNVILTAPQDAGDVTQYGVQKADPIELKSKFKGWDPRLERLLSLAGECSKWSLLESNRNQTWVHPDGGLMLIGDAAHAMPPYLAQGAAQAFEDAAVLGSLFSHVKNREQIPDLMTKFQEIRMSRSMEVLRRSAAMREVFGMPDGIAQQERDAQIAMDPHEGCPIALADPVFQKWLWRYNAIEDANESKGKEWV